MLNQENLQQIDNQCREKSVRSCLEKLNKRSRTIRNGVAPSANPEILSCLRHTAKPGLFMDTAPKQFSTITISATFSGSPTKNGGAFIAPIQYDTIVSY